MEKEPFTKASTFVGVKNPNAGPEPQLHAPGGAGGGAGAGAGDDEFALQLSYFKNQNGWLGIDADGWAIMTSAPAKLRWVVDGQGNKQITITDRGYLSWSSSSGQVGFYDWAYTPSGGWRVSDKTLVSSGTAILSMCDERLCIDPTGENSYILTVKIVSPP